MSDKPMGYTYAIATRNPKKTFVFCKWFTNVQLAIDYAIGEVNDRSKYDVEFILIREGTNNADDPIIWDSRKHMPMQFAAAGKPLVEPMDPHQSYECHSSAAAHLVVYPGEVGSAKLPVIAFVCESMTGQSDSTARAILTHEDVRRLRNQLNQLLGE